jgi:hypothetical protein
MLEHVGMNVENLNRMPFFMAKHDDMKFFPLLRYADDSSLTPLKAYPLHTALNFLSFAML